jgi:hypothetical protein
VVPLAAVRDQVPPSTVFLTPDERAIEIEARRRGAQMRSLW